MIIFVRKLSAITSFIHPFYNHTVFNRGSAAVAGYEHTAMKTAVIDMSGVTELDTDGMNIYM